MASHSIEKAPGVINASEAYTLREFARRSGLGNTALREARRKGLRVIELGAKRYVRGCDWLEFLAAQAKEQQPAK